MDKQDISVEKTFSSLCRTTQNVSSGNMFEEMASWGTGQLKDYLMVRGISYSGSRQEILARAFVAYEQKVEIRMSEKELMSKLNREYSSRLNKCNLIDPRSIGSEEWKDDCTKWPRVDLGKIFAFVIENKDQEIDFVGKYKTHKAYSYYQSGFVDAIYAHKQGNITVLKTKVTPSMSVRNEPHEVWTAIEHDTCNIKCCWCTCIAGFAQTCNHVIATLYKIEFASTMGYTDPSCTSMPCGWNKSTKKTIQPVRLSEMNIRQDNRMNIEKNASINTERKKQFDPRRFDQQQVTTESLSTLLGKISVVKPSAVLFKSLPGAPTEQDSAIPLSIPELAKNHLSCGGNSETFIEATTLTGKQVDKIEAETRAQTNNPTWYEQRKGRLTSSMHHDIYTKMLSIRKAKGSKNIKVSPLISRLLGQSVTVSNIPSVKWGLDMENKAYGDFVQNETLKHENFKVTKCGLVVKKDIPYIASSPDGMCECRCCGKSTLEIKSPYVLASPKPRSVVEGCSDVSFLENQNGKIQLKRSHKYYTQVQSQMAITGCKQGFFVVWSPAGVPLVETLAFDDKHWCTVLQSLVQFYSAYMLNYIFGKTELSFCPLCSNVCLSEQEIENAQENSVCCNICNLWFHWSCAGIKSEPVTESWYCSSCRS